MGVATNAIISIAYYQGAIRSSTIIRQFCEQNIFPIFDPVAIKEIFMDSEYTKEADYLYFKDKIGKEGDLYVCLRQNEQIKKLISPFWKEVISGLIMEMMTKLDPLAHNPPHSHLPLKIVVLRDKEKKDQVRCFGTTKTDITDTDLLFKYRYCGTV